MGKSLLFMAYEAKDGKPKPSDKTEMVNAILEAMVSAEQDERWVAVGLKAPTRATIINWCSGNTSTTNILYLEVISKVTGIAIEDIF